MSDEVLNKQIIALNGKVEALINMISNKADSAVDALQIKDFVEKYSILKSLTNNETVNNMLDTINKLNDKITEIQEQVNIPLSIAQNETQKIINVYKDDKTQLALNIADVKLFKSSVFKSFRDMQDYISKLNIDEKVQDLNAELSFAKQLSDDIIAQRNTIKSILGKVKKQELSIQHMENVNLQQDQQISNANDLIVEMEKQIENYSFFAEEFNKIYTTAKDFISVMVELEHKLNYVVTRDDAIQKTMDAILSYVEQNVQPLREATTKLSFSVEQHSKNLLAWVNDSLMFVNEVKAYNLSLAAYNKKMDEIRESTIADRQILESINTKK